MKKILCYGDSNTFGFNPQNGSRYAENSRWSGILKELLADKYEIIEEGANNRTGFVNNPAGFLYSAPRHLPKILSKSQTYEIIILELGTNDFQFQYNIGFNAIEKGLENLILAAKQASNKVILVPPVVIRDCILQNPIFNKMFDESSILKARKSIKIYKKLARIFGCNIFDFNDIANPSEQDGLHYDLMSHKVIAEKLAAFILQMQK